MRVSHNSIPKETAWVEILFSLSLSLSVTEINSMASRDNKKASSSRAGKIRTLSDLNRPSADSDSDSDGPQEYYTGGEKRFYCFLFHHTLFKNPTFQIIFMFCWFYCNWCFYFELFELHLFSMKLGYYGLIIEGNWTEQNLTKKMRIWMDHLKQWSEWTVSWGEMWRVGWKLLRAQLFCGNVFYFFSHPWLFNIMLLYLKKENK